MRIGYFGRSLGLKGGIARYTSELLAAMERVAPANQYLLYTNRRADITKGDPTVLRTGPSCLGRVGYEQVWLPAQIARDRPDVYHSPDFTLPFAAPGRKVITVHDLIYLRQPEGTSLRARVLYRLLTGASIRRAHTVITVSDYTAREVSEYFDIPREKLRPIPHGVNPALLGTAESVDTRAAVEAMGIQPPFVLFVGLLTPRKGVLELIEAFERVQGTGGLQCLALVGAPGSGFERIQKRVGESPVRDRIRLPGPADDAGLASLYSQASAFCLPSHHEGFGLPVLEAMLLGCPVVAADSTALPEVVGDAGLLSHTGDADSLASALARMLSDADLAGALRASGRRRAAEYTWESTARKTLAVYAEVAGGAS